MAEERRAADAGKGAFLKDVVYALERAGHRLCILRGYAGYPEHVGDDVDAVCADPAAIPRVLSDQGIAVVQAFEHETTFYYLYRPGDDKPAFLTLDVAKDYGYRGRVFLEGEELLNNCRDYEFFKVPAPRLEFVSYLIRKVTQGSVGEAQAERLSSLYREDPEGARQQLDRFFPKNDAALVAGAAWRGDWAPVRRDIGRLRRVMLGKVGSGQRLWPLRHGMDVLRRRAGRLLRPPGLMVAFLGTDGSGKSTIMAEIERDLGPAFWGGKQYHKRPLSSPFRWTKRYRIRPPRVEKPEKATASGFNPHALPSRGAAYSLAKLVFWWIDFTVLGYLVEIFPRLTRLSLLLFDRYFQDLLVDPRRYHYGGSMGLARLVGRLVPQPHLIFLLDAPPEVLRARKQELPLTEVARQREAYGQLVRSLPNGHVVDTSGRLRDAVAEVERVILDFMAQRTAQRLGLRSGKPNPRTP